MSKGRDKARQCAPGQIAVEVLPGTGSRLDRYALYHEVERRILRERPRVLYPASSVIKETYIPLAAKCQYTAMQRISKEQRGESATTLQSAPRTLTAIGDRGLYFATDWKGLYVSVEAAALQHFLEMLLPAQQPSRNEAPPWLGDAVRTWHQDTSLFMFNTATGWRGCFAEKWLWLSLELQLQSNSVRLPENSTL